MYQVLYRKWRPRVFSDVIGQPHVTKTLSGEIETKRLSHAYLFTGSRGTGKTTCAKILAKAVNCLSPKDGNPCNECEICKGLDSGAILDVVEIDAASNNGVDNIRDIRDEVNFTPASCKYRVYIIDEVHMLSAGAFNALLKTLEEPPEHVIFILATTEVHKLPATILSRCQRFDFRRIPSEDMAGRLTYIALQEGLTLEHDAAMLIARLSDGAMRDALSILDQCATRDKAVTADLVSDVAGLTGRVYLFELTNAIKENDCAAALSVIDKLHTGSCDMERLCSELINHLRNLMVTKTVRHAGELIVCTEQEHKQLKQQAEEFTLESILYAIDRLQQAMLNIKKGVNRRIEMEMAVISLCNPALSTDSKAMLKRLAAVENTVKRMGTAPAAPVTAAPVVSAPSAPVTPASFDIASVESEPDTQPGIKKETETADVSNTVQQTAPEQTADSSAQEQSAPSADSVPSQPAAQDATASPAAPVSDVEFTQWAEVLEELCEINKPLWGMLLSSSAFIRGERMLINCPNPALSSFLKAGNNSRDLRLAIYNVTGQKYKLALYKQSAEGSETQTRDSLESLINKVSGTDIKLTIEG